MFLASASLTASFWLCTLSCSQANCADWLPNSGMWMMGMTCALTTDALNITDACKSNMLLGQNLPMRGIPSVNYH